MIHVELVEPKDATRAWPSIRRHITAAVEKFPGVESVDRVRDQLFMGAYVALDIRDELATLGAAVLGFGANDDLRQLNILFIGGENMELWIEKLDRKIVGLAKRWGCNQIVCTGRHGWKKTVTPLGYKLKTMTFVKEL